MTYKKGSPGDNDTINLNTGGGGSVAQSDTDTGTAQTIIGPVSSTFTVSNVAAGPVSISFEQTSP